MKLEIIYLLFKGNLFPMIKFGHILFKEFINKGKYTNKLLIIIFEKL